MAIAPLPDVEAGLELPWPRPALRLLEPKVPVPIGARAGTAVREVPVAPSAWSPATHRRPRAGVSARVRRRRLGFVLAMAGVVIGLAVPVTALGGRPATVPRTAATAVVVPGATVYVVQPGDTLWSIASALDHGGDPRALATAMAKETGSSVVVPGERIRIP